MGLEYKIKQLEGEWKSRGEDLCDPLEMGAGGKDAIVGGLLQGWDKNGRLDLEELRNM